MVKISVNGAPARVMISGPYFPSFSCVLTVPGGKGGNHFYYHSTMFLAGDATLCVPAKNPCTKHNFVAKIMTADRQVQYYTCKQDPKLYYSCSICGLCERNPKHTYQLSEKDKELLSGVHYFEANLATDQAYVGTNAAGEHIYWQSCIWCGMSSCYEQRHLASPT